MFYRYDYMYNDYVFPVVILMTNNWQLNYSSKTYGMYGHSDYKHNRKYVIFVHLFSRNHHDDTKEMLEALLLRMFLLILVTPV